MYIFILLSAIVHAKLGDHKAQHIRNASNAPYSMTEIVKNAHTIREYTDASGNVFAITWSGVSHPDMAEITSIYLNEVNTADTQTEHRRSAATRITISTNVIVEKFGHMGHVQGRAYLPNSMPVAISELQ